MEKRFDIERLSGTTAPDTMESQAKRHPWNAPEIPPLHVQSTVVWKAAKAVDDADRYDAE